MKDGLIVVKGFAVRLLTAGVVIEEIGQYVLNRCPKYGNDDSVISAVSPEVTCCYSTRGIPDHHDFSHFDICVIYEGMCIVYIIMVTEQCAHEL